MNISMQPLAAFTLTAGINTALTAPSGTSLVVKYLSLATNISATAGSYSASIRVGNTASPVVFQNITGITGGGQLAYSIPIALSASGWGIIVSANSGSGLDLLAFGLQVTN